MITKSQIPNLLTGARAFAVPLALVVIFTTHSPIVLFWIFTLAAITDFFDGYLARKWNCVSAFGALVDPVADKLLVALILLYLLQAGEVHLLPVAIILLREIYISALREFLSARNIPLPVSTGGKWKTAMQMISLTALLFALAYNVVEASQLGIITLWIAAALALTSAVHYTRSAWKHF